jgi:hypothetical protein
MEALAILKSHDDTIRSIRQSHEVAPGLSSNMRNGSFPLTFSYRNHHEVIRTSTSFFMMVTALHSTSQTPSRAPTVALHDGLTIHSNKYEHLQEFYHSGLPKVVCGVDKMWSPELIQLRGHDGPV